MNQNKLNRTNSVTELKRLAAAVPVFSAVLLLCLFMTVNVMAQTTEYRQYYMTLDIPEGTIVMSQDTSKYDEVWTKAGITNPSDKLTEFKNMNVVSCLYDPDTHTTVNFISRRSSETVKQFDFLSKSSEEVLQYARGMMSETEDMVLDVSLYEHPQTPFFRLEITVTNPTAPATELIYGTIINGQVIQFDIYRDGTEKVDESFVKGLVDSVYFTKIMTYEEYETVTQKGMAKFIAVLVGFVLFIVLVFVLSSLHNKKEKNKTKRIADAMRFFKLDRSENPSAYAGEPECLGRAVYDNAAIENYIMFNTWIKPVAKLVSIAVILVAIVIGMFRAEALAYAIITASIGVVLFYLTYSHSEKQKEAMKKQYEASLKKTAVVRFYEKYFTVSGLGSIAEYIYEQVTDVRIYKDSMYIYFGTDNAIFIETEQIEGIEAKELRKKLLSRRLK